MLACRLPDIILPTIFALQTASRVSGLGCCSTVWSGSAENEDWRMSSVAGVADSVRWNCDYFEFGDPLPDTRYPRPYADGILFQRSRVRAAHVIDGLSKTLIVGEVISQGRGVPNAATHGSRGM